MPSARLNINSKLLHDSMCPILHALLASSAARGLSGTTPRPPEYQWPCASKHESQDSRLQPGQMVRCVNQQLDQATRLTFLENLDRFGNIPFDAGTDHTRIAAPVKLTGVKTALVKQWVISRQSTWFSYSHLCCHIHKLSQSTSKLNCILELFHDQVTS